MTTMENNPSSLTTDIQEEHALDAQPLGKAPKELYRSLRGMQFGRLTAISPTEKRVRGSVVWECECSCGNKIEVASKKLVEGVRKSCGCLSREPKTSLDLSGMQFGRLTAIRPTEKRWRGSIVWLCRCSCGNEKEVPSALLKSGTTKSCGCLTTEKKNYKDLSGMQFGCLTAIQPTEKRKHGRVVWLCRCSCGNEKEVPTSQLIQGHTKSCGCLAAEAGRSNKKDLSGKQFGRLTAIRPTEKRHGSNIVWLCRCSCGKEKEVDSGALAYGNTKSCGCLALETHEKRRKDLSGMQFGQLTAIRPTEKRKYNSVVWLCRCSCGKEKEVACTCLKQGLVKSCGCLAEWRTRKSDAE